MFAPKFRRKIIYGQLKQDIANTLCTLCKGKGTIEDESNARNIEGSSYEEKGIFSVEC